MSTPQINSAAKTSSAQNNAGHSTTWVLVADGGCAQAYLFHQNKNVVPMHEPQWHSTNQDMIHHTLTPVPGMNFVAETLDNFHVSHDDSGTLIGGPSAAHNSCVPRLDIRDEVKQNLASAIAEKLNHACQNRQFDHLVLAASPKTLGRLRQDLSADVTDRILAEIPKDFTHTPPQELLAHLQETLKL
jgi:protein required for attachment to host cells